mmetsp:Transcript_15310/g.30713  ORF Transcript_15310/g.30713 Transcript_15310/m.30713 type:complete len:283 (-) Transcript_15310:412-1260(-)
MTESMGAGTTMRDQCLPPPRNAFIIHMCRAHVLCSVQRGDVLRPLTSVLCPLRSSPLHLSCLSCEPPALQGASPPRFLPLRLAGRLAVLVGLLQDRLHHSLHLRLVLGRSLRLRHDRRGPLSLLAQHRRHLVCSGLDRRHRVVLRLAAERALLLLLLLLHWLLRRLQRLVCHRHRPRGGMERVPGHRLLGRVHSLLPHQRVLSRLHSHLLHFHCLVVARQLILQGNCNRCDDIAPCRFYCLGALCLVLIPELCTLHCLDRCTDCFACSLRGGRDRLGSSFDE